MRPRWRPWRPTKPSPTSPSTCPCRRLMDDTIPLIGANNNHFLNYTGSGWSVAILDTGVQKSHPALFGKVISEACYSSNVPSPGGLLPLPRRGDQFHRAQLRPQLRPASAAVTTAPMWPASPPASLPAPGSFPSRSSAASPTAAASPSAKTPTAPAPVPSPTPPTR
jgi:hypothetical protein